MRKLMPVPLLVSLLVSFSSDSTAYAETPTEAINRNIEAGWKTAGIKRSAGRSTDSEFLRRVFIDLIGRIPTSEEFIEFDNDKSTDKRARLVNRLLHATNHQPRVNNQRVKSPNGKKDQFLTFNYAKEYADHWSTVWSVWLLSRSGHRTYQRQMDSWLDEALLENRSHKEMVTQLLTASGRSDSNGAVNFIATQLGELNPASEVQRYGRFDAVPITSRVTRLFLGIQTQCAQCHDHPMHPEWKLEDYWGVNAFFRQVNRQGTPSVMLPNRPELLPVAQLTLSDSETTNTDGVVLYERRDGRRSAANPRFLKDLAQAEKGENSNKTIQSLAAGKTRREQLADYVIKHDNFAPAYVNRIWSQLFGRGLNKEPAADDFGSHNEVVHPELLTTLAENFIKYDYDSKQLLEWICNSDVYSLSHVATKELAQPKLLPYFPYMPLKAMSPEVLFESLMTATRAEFTGKSPTEERSAQRARWLSRLVQNFGDDEGNETTFNGTIVQALLMMNGRELNSEIGTSGTNVVQKIVTKHTITGMANPDRIYDDIFITTLSRRPTGPERAKLKLIMNQGAVLPGEQTMIATAKPDTPSKTSKAISKTPPAKKTLPMPMAPKGTAPAYVAPSSPNDVTFYQDLFWALLNSGEFILNH